MKSIIIIFSLLVTFASSTLLRGTTNSMKEESVDPKTQSYSCPGPYFISQINANLGGILDRVNFRCNNPSYSSFGDIGGPLAHVTSPKSNTIRLPNLKKGWDQVNIGYGYYEPKGEVVVVSIQVCQQDKCFETGFFYGLTICSANKELSYACTRIDSFSAPNGQYFTGASATFVPAKKTGYVKSLTPLFS